MNLEEIEALKREIDREFDMESKYYGTHKLFAYELIDHLASRNPLRPQDPENDGYNHWVCEKCNCCGASKSGSGITHACPPEAPVEGGSLLPSDNHRALAVMPSDESPIEHWKIWGKTFRKVIEASLTSTKDKA